MNPLEMLSQMALLGGAGVLPIQRDQLNPSQEPIVPFHHHEAMMRAKGRIWERQEKERQARAKAIRMQLEKENAMKAKGYDPNWKPSLPPQMLDPNFNPFE